MEFSNEIKMELAPFAALRNHEKGIEAVQFNPQKSTEMMTASHDKTICLWDMNKLAPIQSFDCQAYFCVTQWCVMVRYLFS